MWDEMKKTEKKMILVNGESRPLVGVVLSAIVTECGFETFKGVAIALNGQVIPRGDWSAIKAGAGDRVEIVHPLAGG